MIHPSTYTVVQTKHPSTPVIKPILPSYQNQLAADNPMILPTWAFSVNTNTYTTTH